MLEKDKFLVLLFLVRAVDSMIKSNKMKINTKIQKTLSISYRL